MNAHFRGHGPQTAEELIALHDARTSFFLATARHAVLAQGLFARVPPCREGLDAGVRRALLQAHDAGHQAPVVVGAVPFDVRQPAALSVAHAVLRTSPSAPTAHQTTPPNDTCGAIVAPGPRGEAPPLIASPVPEAAFYVRGVARAVERIRADALDKVVLARALDVKAGQPFDVRALLARLRADNPRGYTFAVRVGQERQLIGASPELLVSRCNGVVRANPLAGSAARSTDPVEDLRRARALLQSAKDLEEHRLVVDAVAQGLSPLCRGLDVPGTPSLLATPTMWHLSTEVTGISDADALTLALALHPTPAVCGYPRDAARELIAQTEPFDRGFYAGMLGWSDLHGDGEWIVTIRCADISGAHARIYAGAGVVAESSPQSELAETAAKFRTMLNALGLADEDRHAPRMAA
ncbi:MAG: isochorismate synthase [Pseudomonadota bacterium]|nr:isochorismate synthase [Pseudomonadota bacterium]